MKYIFIFLLFPFAASAQLGITAKINYSNYLHGYKTMLQQNGMKSGFNAGVYWKVEGNRTYIKPSIEYLRRGVATNFNPLNYGWSNDWSFRTNYLIVTIPVGLKVSNTFSINAGGYAGYIIGNVGNFVWWHERPRYAWPVNNRWQHMGVKVLNRFDYGYAVGLEIDLYGLSVTASYMQGLHSVGHKSNKPEAPLQGWMNRTISAGFEVPLRLNQL